MTVIIHLRSLKERFLFFAPRGREATRAVMFQDYLNRNWFQNLAHQRKIAKQLLEKTFSYKVIMVQLAKHQVLAFSFYDGHPFID